MAANERDLSLPADLCQKAEERFAARFGGLEPFLIFVLQEMLGDEATQMDQAEQGVIEKRLRDLGYM
jgi:hypothetical protein